MKIVDAAEPDQPADPCRATPAETSSDVRGHSMRWREKPVADLLRRNQAVAVAVRLSNKCRMVRVGLNLLAKPEDKVVHRPCQRHIRVSPHEMKQFVPGYHMSGSLGEALENFKFTIGQHERLPRRRGAGGRGGGERLPPSGGGGR